MYKMTNVMKNITSALPANDQQRNAVSTDIVMYNYVKFTSFLY